MKKILFRTLVLLFPFFMIGQVGIGSISISPIPGTNDIQLSVYSYCSQVHNLNNFEQINNTPDTIVNLCYVDTGLLMPTNFTTNLTLSDINTGGIQTITVNGFYNYVLGPSQPCNANVIGGTPSSITFEGPLIQPRMFTLSNNTFETKKVSLYPNPNNGNFALELPLDAEPVQLTITDLSGKNVFTTASYSSGNNIQLKGLSKGLYFVKVVYNETTDTVKFIVE